MSKMQIRSFLWYEFKLGHRAAEAAGNINPVFGKTVVKDRTAQLWFRKFRSGDESLQDEEGRGGHFEIDHEELKTIVEADPRRTCRDMAKELNVHYATVSRHLRAIGKTKKLDKWVPHELTEYQKLCRLEACSALLQRNGKDPFLDRIVTCDGKWILYDNRKRSAQWLNRNESPKHFPKPKVHQKKVMVSVWWITAGVVHYKLFGTGETVTSDNYCNEIEIMHQKLQQMRPALVNRKGPILLHGNARPHVAQKR
uniref:HTH_48 domain-containing protein n=1 Tax=Trichuris muris TaxID=70415 RepID=A0A5S6Q0M7_TRIMR